MPAIIVELARHFAKVGLCQDIIRLILLECKAHQLKRLAMRQLRDIVLEEELAVGMLIEDQISEWGYVIRWYPQDSMVGIEHSYSDPEWGIEKTPVHRWGGMWHWLTPDQRMTMRYYHSLPLFGEE
jgi:hypothetical protein